MEVPEIEVQGIAIPYVPHTWVNSPHVSIPRVPSITETIYIGVPIINIPGCVEAHKDGKKNKVLKNDDPKGTQVFCDADTPSFDPIDYTPENLTIVKEAPPPPMANTEQPNLETPPIPEIPTTTESEEVTTTEEPESDWVETYLPSPAEVSTTASIAVVATAAAAATPLLLRVVKPIVKQLIKKIQKALGKEPPKLSLMEIKTNEYRIKKGLNPLKRPKKKKNQ
mgnify:FL=1|tara:strand:- start:1132 stop:1803 length:672 start_codon:yes stop_codon:yes gene_type:complete